MTLLTVALALIFANASAAVAAPHRDAKLIVGTWICSSQGRPTRIIVFHADGTWGVRKFDERPEDISGRRWRLEGNNLILTYPSDNGLGTPVHMLTHSYRMISFTDKSFTTETQDYTQFYKRYH